MSKSIDPLLFRIFSDIVNDASSFTKGGFRDVYDSNFFSRCLPGGEAIHDAWITNYNPPLQEEFLVMLFDILKEDNDE